MGEFDIINVNRIKAVVCKLTLLSSLGVTGKNSNEKQL